MRVASPRQAVQVPRIKSTQGDQPSSADQRLGNDSHFSWGIAHCRAVSPEHCDGDETQANQQASKAKAIRLQPLCFSCHQPTAVRVVVVGRVWSPDGWWAV